MGSVNANVRTQLPQVATPAATDTPDEAPPQTRDVDDVGTPGTGFLGGLNSIGMSVGNTLRDVVGVTMVGVNVDDEDGGLVIEKNPVSVGALGVGTVGGTAIVAAANRTNALTGQTTPYLESLGSTAKSAGIKVTPTLVSAVAGPAIADGVTMIAPNLVKKYKDTKNIKSADEKKQAEKDNQYAKISRGVAGAVVVGLAAGAVFLLKPDIFKKFGVGVTHAIEGSTKFTVDGGKAQKLIGVLDDATIRSTLQASGQALSPTASIDILRTVSPMAKDAVFSNRVLMAGAGGLGTLMLANAAAGSEDPDRSKLLWGLTAAAGAATVGATYGIGKLTQSQISATGEATGVLAKNELFWKPNIEWIKKYGSMIAPITAIPAYTSASTYFNIFNDFDEITSSRSPFRK